MTTETHTPPAVVISTDLLCDEWHTHAGGICPLKTGTRYSAKHRDGSITLEVSGMTTRSEATQAACPLDRLVRGNGGTRHLCDKGTEAKLRDVVYTPDAVAAAIVERYKPTGRVLDPCRGDGAFWRHMPGAEHCEITEGLDFFDWHEPVDWIVGNPPYSVMNRWLEHSFKVADNVVYLIPVAKVFGSLMRLRMIAEYGGVAEVWAPWTGRAIGFGFGWAVGAVHFKRGYVGGTVFDIVAPNAR